MFRVVIFMTISNKRTIVHLISGLNRAGAGSVLIRLVLNDDYYNHVVVSMMVRAIWVLN